ncbi:TlpA family protein disulfide reductase [Natrarchaeobius halalkaliphilus]|uniref:TlpA family protein disulfide reductase n=1 Tax=Natrarchaeobius halalkaliphilus TaxID=1679091 RepID=A0A3N6LLN5_9EURY|nr:TlpA disulfide reductase family protein [Natrarchaeobius halalkaliphilus]RQG89923.1 TlpA family protein disulfide reductase [Natrarchaeobius halalkaliphilus]
MNRRELVAGIGSVVLLAGAGGVMWRGLPAFADPADGSSDLEDAENQEKSGETDGSLEVPTIDANGSEAGALTVPDRRATVATFFVTGCGQCQAQMPRLAEAHSTLEERHGDDVAVLSVTYQTPETMPENELREWWADLGGNWSVGYDPSPSLAATYGAVGYPVTIVVDENGEKHWHENGVQRANRIVRAAESVLEAGGD